MRICAGDIPMPDTGGQWSWWRNGTSVVVGWMPFQPFGKDIPICTVRDSRDAGLVVDLLTTLEAERIA